MTDITDIKNGKRYPGRIIGIEDALPDTRIFRIETTHRQRVPFEAGQYALLSLGGLPAKPFSIASAPHENFLEFHIRNTGKGDAAKALAEAAIGADVTVELPFGENYRRVTPRPLLLIAGGMGIAPVKSILEAHLTDDRHAPARLYWGVRNRTQLYLDHLFRTFARKSPQFSYVPVLSDETGDGSFRTGFPVDAVTEDFPSLEDFTIYIAGPPQMVEATLIRLLQQGADRDHIYSDGFTA